jgi:AraC-like DNA-binding protein
MQTSNSPEVGRGQEPVQGSLLGAELKDFIRRVVVPILVGLYLEDSKKDSERGVGQFDREIFNRLVGAIAKLADGTEVTLKKQDKPGSTPAEYLTVEQVATILQVSTSTVARQFGKMEGVIDLGTPERLHKRRRRTVAYRIVLGQLLAAPRHLPRPRGGAGRSPPYSQRDVWGTCPQPIQLAYVLSARSLWQRNANWLDVGSRHQSALSGEIRT